MLGSIRLRLKNVISKLLVRLSVVGHRISAVMVIIPYAAAAAAVAAAEL